MPVTQSNVASRMAPISTCFFFSTDYYQYLVKKTTI
jgi:hypothetical protein